MPRPRGLRLFLRDAWHRIWRREISASSARTRATRTDGRTCGGHQPDLGRGSFRLRRSPGPDGRVMEVLSEHQCQGWLEGYLRTGRHGFFRATRPSSIIDSMFNQHAKWLKVTRHIPGAGPLPRSTIFVKPRVAAGPQRLQPPGPASSTTSTRRPRWSGSAPGCHYLAVGHRPLPAQPQLRQRGRGRQAAGPQC